MLGYRINLDLDVYDKISSFPNRPKRTSDNKISLADVLILHWFLSFHPVYVPCADKPWFSRQSCLRPSLLFTSSFFSAVICKARRVFHLAGSVASLCLWSVLADCGENTQVLLSTRLKCPQALMPTRCCLVSSLGLKAWVASVNRIAVHKRITNVFFFTFPN